MTVDNVTGVTAKSVNPIELVVLVRFWLRESLDMHWLEFLDGRPVAAERESAIWSRLAELLAALGSATFDGTVRQACREFFSEVNVRGTGDEAKRMLRDIFLFGDATQQH